MVKNTSASRVLVAGATGLIGRCLLAQLLAQVPPLQVHALVRRPPTPTDARVQWQTVDFAQLPALPPALQAFCGLGTTLRQAGSQAAFRAVDFDTVLAFAQAARSAGVRHFAVVSALGASPRAASFYNRVKGEMEQAVGALGFDSVLIARPSLLAGDRSALGQPPRTAERLALWLSTPFAGLIPAGVRPIKADVVARAMIQGMRQPQAGVRIVESGELQELGAE